MPKINLVSMYAKGDGGVEDYKQQQALAKMLMDEGNSSVPPIRTTGQGLVHAGAKALGGFLAGQAMRENQAKEEEAWNPLKAIVENEIAGLSSGGSASASSTPASGGGSGSEGYQARSVPSMAMDNSGGDLTFGLLKKFEGYRDKPYYDVNAHRVGFGSDTVTDPKTGLVQRVRPGMRITPEMAEADLKRRVTTEFQPSIAKEVPNFAQLPENVRAALTSVTYNYGNLPDSVSAAARTGDPRAIAQAIQGLSGHNGGVNARRRMQEAQVVLSGAGGRDSMVGGGMQTGDFVAGAPGPARPPQMPSLPQPDFGQELQAMRQAQQLMANPRTRQYGLQLYQQAQQSVMQKRQAYMKGQQELALKGYDGQMEVYKLDRNEVIEREKLGIDKSKQTLEERKSDHEKGKPIQLGGTSRLVDPSGKIIVDANPQAGGEIVLPDGTRVTTGPKLTEQQSKDIGFYERGVGANDALEPLQEALTSFSEKAGGSVPFVGNYFKSEDYQKAEQAGKEFLAAVLRKDSGGAITAEEMVNYGDIFLPKPGDKPGTINQKAAARHRAMVALYKGLGPAQALAAAAPKEFDGKSIERKKAGSEGSAKQYPGAPEVGYRHTGSDGKTYIFKGGDPNDAKNWSPGA